MLIRRSIASRPAHISLRFHSTVLFFVMFIVALSFGCSSRKAADDRSGLDDVVALYINGEYAAAIDALHRLVGELQSDEDVITAYLYLGRSYEAMGDYVAAADAYSTGRILGGGARFDEHLAIMRGHLRAAPRSIQTQRSITRAQLAALLIKYSGFAEGSTIDASDMQAHWAKAYASGVWRRGVMSVMPDGRFHPDDMVTMASFYTVMLRASSAMRVPQSALDAYFPGGYRAVLANAGTLVSGQEATEVLGTLAASVAE